MPTALELIREEWQPYIDAARRRTPSPKLSPLEQRKHNQLLVRVRRGR